jgi:hypothetical protein
MTEPVQGHPLMKITPELCAALAKLQADLPKIDRDREVEVETKGDKPNYSYSYATLAHVTQKIMPELAKNGLSYSAYPGMSVDGKGMCLRYFLLHESGGYIGGEFPIAGEGGIQGVGGRITYAKRYALLAVTGLAAEEDDDAARAQAEDDANAKPGTARRNPRAAEARTERAAANTAKRNQRGASPTSPAPAGAEGDQGPREVRNPDDGVSGDQQTKLIMQFKDLAERTGAGASREQRLAMVSTLLGFQVGSITELTKGQAHELISTVDSALATDDPLGVLRRVGEDVANRQAESTHAGSPE